MHTMLELTLFCGLNSYLLNTIFLGDNTISYIYISYTYLYYNYKELPIKGFTTNYGIAQAIYNVIENKLL